MKAQFFQMFLIIANLAILLAWSWYKMFSEPLKFEDPKNYDDHVDWLLSLDETERKISE